MHLQPVPPKVAEHDLERVVRREFPPDQFAAVMAILQTCRSGDSQETADRVRAALLKLSAGNVAWLRRHIEVANFNPNDLLARAESPGYRQIEVRIGNGRVPTELQQRIIDEDRRQYEEWLDPTRGPES